MMKKVKKNHGAASLNSVLANAQKKAELGASLITFAEAAYANGEIREASNFMLTASAEFFSCRDDLVRAAEVNTANRAQLLEAAGAMFGAAMDANDKSTLIYNGDYVISKGGPGSGRRPKNGGVKESGVHARQARELRYQAALLHSEGINENHGKVDWRKMEGLIREAESHEAESKRLISIGKGGPGSGRHAEGVNIKDASYYKKASKDIADRADKLSDDTKVAYTSEAARQHEGLAKEHEILAQTADAAGKQEIAKAHREAAQMHHYAAEAHRSAWKTSEDEEGYDDLTDEADSASYGAADASQAASEAEGN
jgi:hypothetical protein